jgi:hypothetical protein
LQAVNCQNGDTLAQEQSTASAKEKILSALGETASKLRGELGESLVTVHKFNVPLVQATTSSLEALQAVTLGLKAFGEKGSAASVPYFQRAIQLDPKFAMAYALLSHDFDPTRARDRQPRAGHRRPYGINEQGELLHEMYGDSALATVEDITEDPELVELVEARQKKLERLEQLKSLSKV